MILASIFIYIYFYDNTVTTASTVAPLIFRASPIDPTLRSPSSEGPSQDLATGYQTLTPADGQTPPHGVTTSDYQGHSLPSPDSILPPLSGADTQDSGSGLGNGHFSTTLATHPSLPGLSALASVASAPTSQLRYVFYWTKFIKDRKTEGERDIYKSGGGWSSTGGIKSRCLRRPTLIVTYTWPIS